MFSADADKEKRDEAFFLNGIKHLAKLYDFDAGEQFDYLAFQHILDGLDENFTVISKLREVSVAVCILCWHYFFRNGII